MQENTAQTAAEWVFVAKSVSQMPDGQNPALRCMARANMAAQDMEGWLTVAKAWVQDFGDAAMGRQCMAKAEDIAGHSEEIEDWGEIAKIWHNVFQDSGKVIQCMESAENYAADTFNWIGIAKIWKSDFQDTNNAIRCMEKAKEVADYFEDYAAIEETWRVDFQDFDSTVVSNAIQSVVDAADDEGHFDGILSYFNYRKALKQENITDLGILTETSISHTGAWSDKCVSERRQGSYAKYYIFTLAQTSEITIELISDTYIDVDTYLYLISGDAPTGEVLDENDDIYDGEDLSSTDSRIKRNLPAGTYTIEATTYREGEIGIFHLNITIG